MHLRAKWLIIVAPPRWHIVPLHIQLYFSNQISCTCQSKFILLYTSDKVFVATPYYNCQKILDSTNNKLCFIYKEWCSVCYIILATIVPTLIHQFAVSCWILLWPLKDVRVRGVEPPQVKNQSQIWLQPYSRPSVSEVPHPRIQLTDQPQIV